jgi:hypothetical protein
MQFEDPHPTKWTLQHRFVSLAFFVGIFQALHGIISRRDDVTLLYLHNMLAPESGQRTIFLRAVVELATAFLEAHSEEFAKFKNDAAKLEKLVRTNGFLPEGDSLKNNTLAMNLAPHASSYVFEFFTVLNSLPQFGRGEGFGIHLV